MKTPLAAVALCATSAFASPANDELAPGTIPAGNLRVVFCDNSSQPIAFNIILTAPKADLTPIRNDSTVSKLMRVMTDTATTWGYVVEPQLKAIAKGHGGSREQTLAQQHDPESPLMRDIRQILTQNMNQIIKKNEAEGTIGYFFSRPSPSREQGDLKSCGAQLSYT
jgi:hypothetical protein